MSDLERLVSDLSYRRPAYKLYADYYNGHQPIVFSGEKLQSTFGKALASLSCNRCGNVVDAFGDRLQITGFENRAENKGSDRKPGNAVDAENDDADAIWDRNNGPKIAGEVHQEAFTAGDGFLIVWPGLDGLSRLYVQDAANMAIVYNDDDPGVIDVAAKLWRRADGSHRLNIYYADHLEKWFAVGKGTASTQTGQQDTEIGSLADDAAWQPYDGDGDADGIVRYEARQMGTVPVFHFPNNGRRGRYGRSELADIIPLQDRLNMTLANAAIAEEMQSYRQRWATGIQPVLDPETKQPISPFKPGPGVLWMTPAKDATFGEFGAADLIQFDTNAEGWERRIARTAKVPLHYVVQTGTPPSGESLKTAEAPFVSKVRDRQAAWGEVWERAIELALMIDTGKATRVKTLWASAETRDETAFWQAAPIKIDSGYSERAILREWGKSEDEIDQMAAEKADEAKLSLDMAQKAFNAGGGFPNQGKQVDENGNPTDAAA